MSIQVQLRRGTSTVHENFIGAPGEITVDTTKNTAVVHDGVTEGGHPLVKENNSNLTGNTTVENLSVSEGITSNLIPDVDITRDLGSSTKRWRELYLSGNTIYLGDKSISVNEDGIDFGSSSISSSNIPSLDASKITTGTLSIDRLPNEIKRSNAATVISWSSSSTDSVIVSAPIEVGQTYKYLIAYESNAFEDTNQFYLKFNLPVINEAHSSAVICKVTSSDIQLTSWGNSLPTTISDFNTLDLSSFSPKNLQTQYPIWGTVEIIYQGIQSFNGNSYALFVATAILETTSNKLFDNIK
jgi:hypothetical protein